MNTSDDMFRWGGPSDHGFRDLPVSIESNNRCSLSDVLMKPGFNVRDTFTKDDVKSLIASAEDIGCRLIVTWQGDVRFLTIRDSTDIRQHMRHWITWECGNGYVGQEAANDPKWVDELFWLLTVIREYWDDPVSCNKADLNMGGLIDWWEYAKLSQ